MPSSRQARIALLLAAALPTAAAASETSPRLNVLFIAVDDLRPAIGAYGDKMAVTPHIDSLAKQGAVFERAYCQQAVCSPSRISLLTGLRPGTTGIYDLKTHHRDRVPDIQVLPQYFREHGYRTAGRGKIFHGNLDDPKAWDSSPYEGRSAKDFLAPRPPAPKEDAKLRSQDSFLITTVGSDGDTPASAGKAKPRTRGPAWKKATGPDHVYTDGKIADEAIALLGELRDGGRPFFLAVGFLKPHLPFIAPVKYWDLHDREALWPPPNRSLPEGTLPWTSQPGWELRNQYSGLPSSESEPLDIDTEKNLRHGYYACTSYVDAQIGKVLAALDGLDLTKSTIVVLWGDHGYHVGDHGTWCKHTNYEIAVHSPLLLRVPDRGKGVRVPATVELLDVYPTLVELAGLPLPPHLEGRSLAPFLDNPSRAADKPAFSQYPRSDRNGMMGYSVTTGRWRYTEWLRDDNGAIELRELYDLAKDPHVTRNLAADPAFADEVAKHHQLLAGASRKVPELRARAVESGNPADSGGSR